MGLNLPIMFILGVLDELPNANECEHDRIKIVKHIYARSMDDVSYYLFEFGRYFNGSEYDWNLINIDAESVKQIISRIKD